MTFCLELPSDRLDLPLCVSCGQVFRWRECLEEPGRWQGVDGATWYDVTVRAMAKTTQYQVVTNGNQRSFERLFRLDVDEVAALATIVKAEPKLEPFIKALPGLRLMRPSDPVEEAFCFLCTPNNNLTRILRMVSSLGSYGVPFSDAPVGLTKFPTLESIASIPEAELRTIGFGYRAATIPSIARQMMDRGGPEWLRGLTSASYHEAHVALRDLKGIGPKLADCICLFALHHEDAVPVDTHLWQAAVRMYFPEWEGAAMTDGRYQEVGDVFRSKFGRLAGWAHQYLFYDNMLNWRGRRASK